MSGAFQLFRLSHASPLLGAMRLAGSARYGSKLAPAAPGTVSAYAQHIFIDEGQSPAEWPAAVERSPALLQTFSEIAKLREEITGTVKVTAFTPEGGGGVHRAAGGTCNVMLFPAGLGFWNLQLRDLKSVVQNFVAEGPPAAQTCADAAAQQLDGLHLFVCSHGSRDARCGKIGPPLARRLRSLAQAQPELAGLLHVYECSHIGGHKYAGNVLVYGAISPNDGDWFGGVHAADAADFLQALTQVEFGSEGGFDHPRLRQWWRGRMGLTKEEQKAAFEAGTLGSGESGFESDEAGPDIEAVGNRPR